MPKFTVRRGHSLIHCSSVSEAVEIARRLDGDTVPSSSAASMGPLEGCKEAYDLTDNLGGAARHMNDTLLALQLQASAVQGGGGH